jgi:L-iditol 2-dehydrogenase
MLAAVCDGLGRFEVRQVDDPTPGPGEVLVRVTACGVCGTDLHIADGTYHADYPLVPGHELSGVVEEVGAGVAGLEPGTPIAMNPNLPCRRCRQCRRGRPHLCESPQAVGVTRDGGFAEFVVMPVELALPQPEGLPVATAALMEPTSCCLHGLDVAAPRTGDRVIILGAGTVGLLMTQLVRLHGAAQVAVSEPVASKRELALRLGADCAADPTTADDLLDALDGPADLVIEASGTEAAAQSALDLVDVGGTVLFFGVCDERVEVPVSPRRLFRDEITIRGAYTNPFTDERALALLTGGAVEVGAIISDRFPLAEAAAAMSRARESESLKVVIEP